MCHSVEMYLPRMIERHAEHRIGARVRAATDLQHATVRTVRALVFRLKTMVPGGAAGMDDGAMQERQTDV